MIRKVLVLSTVVLAAVAVSGTASATTTKQCTTLRAKVGATSFGHAFTTLGACVTSLAPLQHRNTAAARTTCQSARIVAVYASVGGCVAAQTKRAETKELSLAAICTLKAPGDDFASCFSNRLNLTVSAVQPTPEPATQTSPGGNISGGCGGPTEGGPGIQHPLATSCTVANAN